MYYINLRGKSGILKMVSTKLLNENNFESINQSTITNFISIYKMWRKINVQIQNRLSFIINFLIINNSSNAYKFNKCLLSIK